MGKLRFLLALWLGKLSIPALKITHHNGTDFPGSLAVRLCPDFLRYVGKPKTIVAVTGTNGKTTVSNMLNDILEAGATSSTSACSWTSASTRTAWSTSPRSATSSSATRRRWCPWETSSRWRCWR